jgi:trans-2,3-dihydro-3-hydroxyanthranilate isomerase
LRRYAILDVFTGHALAGNQLAVVLEPDGLDTVAMQSIAREFNLAETVFVFPPHNDGHRAALRIFTTLAELPFAGHPTVGTAVFLALRDETAQERFVLEEEIGPVDCTVRLESERHGYARFVVPRLPYAAGEPAERATIATALGLAPDDIGFPGHEPSRFGVGAPFTMVPLRDLDALGRARPESGLWPVAFGESGHNAAFLYTPGGEDADFRARMFAPGMGLGEDPATGSAAASFAGVVMLFDRPSDGDHRLRIAQGVEMGRPSLIELGLSVASGQLTGATIGGHAVLVAEGQLYA